MRIPAPPVPEPLIRALRRRLEPPMLREGENAPEWSLQGHDGAWHHLAEGGWALLVFYPADATPGCTLQLRELEEHRERLGELGCRVFGLNPASIRSHAAFARDQDLRFPLLSDTNGAVARQYRALLDLPLLGPRVLRTVYLVNPARKIRLANRGTPSVAAIVRSIEALQKATRAAM
jgi:peroxiredoxin Q/BCP